MGMKKMLKRLLPDSAIIGIKKITAIRNNHTMLEQYKKIRTFKRGHYLQGINLIGDIRAETGIGQSMRILAAIMENEGIPYCVKQVNLHGELEHNDNAWEHKIVDSPKFGINVINIIPETWALDYTNLEKEVLDYRYNIAFWPWELEEFPDRWLPCIRTVNEIWTPSEFVSRSIRKKASKPVITVPHIVDMKKTGYLNREYFALPEGKFLFLTMYDFISVSERKNPRAVIDAYMTAFPVENQEVGLVIKVNHAEEKQLQQLKAKLKDYKNIYFVTQNLTRLEVDSLLNNCDVLVSLHRSEGFGLPVAEAMALGKPVISTNYSATTEFMDESSGCLVDYKLINLRKSIGPYEAGNVWADPDIRHAASFMCRLWEDKGYCKEIGLNAEKYIKEHLTYKYAADIIRNRLNEIDKL